jgi:hypothetical protein
MHRKSHTAEDTLFDRARDFRAAGSLPRHGGDAEQEYGSNLAADCSLSGSLIENGSPHVVLRWTDEVAGGARTAALHPYCHGIWLVTGRPRQPAV